MILQNPMTSCIGSKAHLPVLSRYDEILICGLDNNFE